MVHLESMKTCYMCKEEKPEEAFSWKKKGVRRQSHCKECHKIYRDKHYRENREKYIAMAADRKVDYCGEFFAWLEEQSCLDCGNSDKRVLEFDHVRGEKLGNIAVLLRSASRQRLWDEIAKCEIVCANCHRVRTATRAGWYSNYAAKA